MLTKLEAIVLRPNPFSEGSLVLSFLTEQGEKISGLAHGARKPSSKWVSAFEPLSLVHLHLFGREQSSLHRITRCDLRHSPLVPGNLESALVIACLAELFDRIAREGMEDPRLFRLLSACSRELKVQPHRAMTVLFYAEHWLLYCLGLLPPLRHCAQCHEAIQEVGRLDSDRGWICWNCDPQWPLGVRVVLEKLRQSPLDQFTLWDPHRPAHQSLTRELRFRLQRELGGRFHGYRILEMVQPSAHLV